VYYPICEHIRYIHTVIPGTHRTFLEYHYICKLYTDIQWIFFTANLFYKTTE